jgi:hypothetical protein
VNSNVRAGSSPALSTRKLQTMFGAFFICKTVWLVGLNVCGVKSKNQQSKFLNLKLNGGFCD